MGEKEVRRERYPFESLLSAEQGETKVSSNVNESGIFRPPGLLSRKTDAVAAGTT